MATAKLSANAMTPSQALNYQQAMQNLHTVVVATPPANGIVKLQPGQLTQINTQAGQHYKVRKIGSDGKTLEVPDNLIAERHGDALHLRYADGSTASFENFFSECTDSSVCSVNVAGDTKAGVTLNGADVSGGAGDDGLLVYAHGNHDVLMAMAQGQDSLSSAILNLDEMEVVTYLPPLMSPLTMASIAAVSVGAALSNNGTNHTTGPTLTPGQALAAITAAAENNTASSSTPSANVYAIAGVSGVTAVNLALINSTLNTVAIDGAAVDTVGEIQTLVDAANHVFVAAGGSAPEAAALTATDLATLDIGGVTTNNLVAVQAAIQAVAPDSTIDSQTKLQHIVNTALGSVGTALNTLADAAENNTAASSALVAAVYTSAGVNNVTLSNVAYINNALDSTPINGARADTSVELQAIVDGYNAIIASADGVANNTSTPLTAAQYMAIGVTGVSGTATPGSALALLDDVVDTLLPAGVDAVAEVQILANAANHVMAAAGGTAQQASAVTQTDLAALGITGITQTNLTFVQAAIQATSPDSGIDTQSELQAIVSNAIHAHPVITNALNGVINLDVTSNLVLSVDQTVTVGTGLIHITDLGGSNGGTGYQNDTTNNTQTIDVATAVANGLISITGTGANTRIIINPLWDLDLSSNYQITIDSGAFLDATGTNVNTPVAPITFSTVIPGVHSMGTAATEAAVSQIMVDATGALTASKSWYDIQGLSNNASSVIQLGDLSTGAYALVMKNYATTRGGAAASHGDKTDGIATHDTNVSVTNFGNNDVIYFDSQVNNSAVQFFDARYTSMTDGSSHGGQAGQNMLVMGLVATPTQLGSTASILLGLEGNTNNTIYPAVYTLDANTLGWANAWHNASAPMIMG